METFYFKSTREIKKEKENLEKKLGITIVIKGRQITIEGPAVNEYEAKIILEAMQFGFSAYRALILLNENMMFRKLNIKDHTRKKNLKEVRGRIIGKEGKTKKTIENIANCDVCINDNEIGFICPASEIEETTTAITSLVKGTKQSNVYSFLEKMNRERKKYNS